MFSIIKLRIFKGCVLFAFIIMSQAKTSKNILTIAFITIGVVIIALGAFYFSTYTNLKKTDTISVEENVVLEYMLRLDYVKQNFLAIEAAERPTLVNAKNELIDDFNKAAQSDSAEFAGFKKLYQYPFLPVGALINYELLVKQKISFTRQIIELGLEGKKDLAYGLIEKDENFALVKNINNTDQFLENSGRKLLHQYQDQHKENAKRTENEFLLLGFCMLLFLCYGLFRIIKAANFNSRISNENKFLADIFNRVSDAVLITDHNLNILYFNPAAEQLYKRDKEQVVGKHVVEGIGFIEPEGILEKMIQDVNNKGSWAGELKNSYPDGTAFTVFTSISAIKNAQNKVIAYSSINFNFSEYRKNRENENYLAKIFDFSYEAIIATDNEHRIKGWNKAAEKMFGYSQAEVIGKITSDILNINQEKRKEFRTALLEKGEWEGEVDVENREGKLMNTYFTVATIKNEKGEVTDKIATYRDLTNILKLQRELKLLNQNLQEQVNEKTAYISEILGRISDGFVAMDNNAELTFVNDYIEKVTGKTESELIGKNYLELFPALKETQFAIAVGEAIQNQKTIHYEVYSQIWNMWLDINIYPSFNGISVFLKDISLKKEQEKDLLLKESAISKSIAGMGLTDLNGNIIYGNEALACMWGYENKEQLIGLRLIDVFEGERVYTTIQNLQTKGFDSGEDTGKRRDGSLFDVGFSANIITDELNQPICMFGSFVDITERKKQAAEINKLASIIEFSNALVGIMSLDYKILYLNAATRNILELDEEEPIAEYSPFDFFPERQNQTILAEVMEKGSWSGENFLITKSKKKIPIFQIVILHKNERGVPLYISSNGINLTELKLKQSENQRLADIIDNSMAFTAIATLDKNIIYANRAMKTTFGFDLKDETVLDLAKLYTPRGNMIREQALEVVKKKGRWQGENEMITPDGRIIPIFQSILEHKDEDGNATFTSTTALDITELKVKEEENNRLLSMLENSAAIVGIIDMEGNLQYANKTLRKNLEVKHGEDIRKYNINFFRTPAGVEKIQEVRKELYETGRWKGENYYHSISGREYTLYQVMILHRDVNGNPNYISTTAIDITDLKQKQEETDLYLSVLNNSTAYFGIADENLKFIYVNQALRDVFEIKPDEDISSYNLSNFKGPNSVSFFSNPLHPLHHTKKWVGENIYLSKSGKEIPVLQVVVLHEYKGKLKYVSTTAINIAELKEKEVEKDRLIQMINSSPAYFAMTDMESNILFTNEAIREALEISDEKEILYKSFNSFRSDKGNIILQQALDDLQKKDTWQGENYYRSVNGKEIPVLQALHLHKKEGKPSYISSTAIDLTQLKEKEKELNKLASIIENTKALIIIVDLNMMFLYLNQAAKDRFGIGPEEDITKLSGLDFIPDETKEMMKTEEAKLFASGKWIGELNFLNRKGEKIPVLEVAIIHKDEAGNPLYISLTLVDITEQKEAENELLHLNNELRELSNHLQDIREEERSEIAREIHDVLGQNLTVLKMAASWIKKHIYDNPAGAERRLEELMDVTDETIQSSRKLYNALHPNMLDDIGLLAAIQWHANTVTKATGIDIEVFSNFSHKILNPKLRLGLYRIYQESLTNILRHSKATHVLVNVNRESQSIVLSISDNGIGFDTTQVDIMHSHGLLGMRERVYAMSGTLKIQTEMAKGTIIEVRVPLSKELMGAENFENVL